MKNVLLAKQHSEKVDQRARCLLPVRFHAAHVKWLLLLSTRPLNPQEHLRWSDLLEVTLNTSCCWRRRQLLIDFRCSDFPIWLPLPAGRLMKIYTHTHYLTVWHVLQCCGRPAGGSHLCKETGESLPTGTAAQEAEPGDSAAEEDHDHDSLIKSNFLFLLVLVHEYIAGTYLCSQTVEQKCH